MLKKILEWKHRKKALIIGAGAVVAIIVALVISISYKFALVEKRLNDRGWSIASTVYAEAPDLTKGTSATQEWLIHYFQSLKYGKSNSPVPRSAEYSIRKDGIAFRDSSPGNRDADIPVLIVVNNGRVQQLLNLQTKQKIADYHLQPIPVSDLFGSHMEKRSLIKYSDLPANLVHAVIAIEDHRFFHHHGVDFVAIGRAAWNDVRGRKLQGASTITQQLVKNFFLSRERSLSRKMNEVAIAFILETRLSKEEILELYMNEIYLGQNGAMNIHGVQEASRFYFGKDVRNLTIPEAALIAGMIQAPQTYNPYRNPAEAKQRRDTVLQAMYESGDINEKQFKDSVKAPIVLHPYEPTLSRAPYFADLVTNQLLQKFTAEEIHNSNLKIYTTLDLDMQQEAEDALQAGLDRIDKIHAKTDQHVQGCIVAMQPSTGAIKAYVGGSDYAKTQFDRIMKAVRQPGSTFKPVVYAAAINTAYRWGDRVITPSTLLSDEPWDVTVDKAAYRPENYDGRYHGVVSVRQALAQSMNIATVRLAQIVGIQNIAALATDLGFDHIKPYPSLALGTTDATPWQVIRAYSAFANAGYRTEPKALERVTDEEGNSLAEYHPQNVQVLSPQTAYIITNMLRTVVTSGTGASIQRRGVTRPVAGKTGTSNDFRDAWFIGFSPDLICLVWIGYDDGTPLNMNAAQAAVPVWAGFMREALQKYPIRDFAVPNGIVTRTIDPTTGKVASDACVNRVTEFYIEGSEPLDVCTDYDHYLPASSFVGPQMRHGAEQPLNQANYTPYSTNEDQQSYGTEPAIEDGTSNPEDDTTEQAPNQGTLRGRTPPEPEENTQPQFLYFAPEPPNMEPKIQEDTQADENTQSLEPSGDEQNQNVEQDGQQRAAPEEREGQVVDPDSGTKQSGTDTEQSQDDTKPPL